MLLANNPSSSQTEDAVRGFVTEVSELDDLNRPALSVTGIHENAKG